MSVSIDGKTIIITGAASGIGRATAEVLHDMGTNVVLADLYQKDLDEVLAELDLERSRIIGCSCDVTVANDVEKLVATAVEKFGKLDGLVNSAGVIMMDNAWDTSNEDMKQQFSVNVEGTFRCSRAVALQFRANDGGSIVNVASNCGKVGYQNMAAYNASKAAVISLTRSLSLEWSENNINVNAVCPGGVDTPMLANCAEWLGPKIGVESAELLSSMVPAQLGRHIKPIEVAKIIAFLLSEDAIIIRGQAINLDGGDTPY